MQVLLRALKGVNFAASTIISSVSNAATWQEDQEKFSAYGKVGRAGKPLSLCGCLFRQLCRSD
jgi:hypothetical protein